MDNKRKRIVRIVRGMVAWNPRAKVHYVEVNEWDNPIRTLCGQKLYWGQYWDTDWEVNCRKCLKKLKIEAAKRGMTASELAEQIEKFGSMGNYHKEEAECGGS